MHTCVEGSKRQLPPWMTQKVGASSSNAVETNCSIKKGDIISANATKKDHKSEASKRKSNLRAEEEDGSGDKVTLKKKGGKSKDSDQRSSVRKRKKSEDPSHGCYDAMDLTVEDLMAIAEQYVKDYENKDRKEISSTNETGTTLDSPCENKDLSNSTSTTGELIATSTSQTQTGDPTQDMLNLFLGPLLRITLEKEKSKSIIENVKITPHEYTRPSEIVPLMKKRNSLKDKVAMFLDQDM